jgi:hypothetical protein
MATCDFFLSEYDDFWLFFFVFFPQKMPQYYSHWVFFLLVIIKKKKLVANREALLRQNLGYVFIQDHSKV